MYFINPVTLTYSSNICITESDSVCGAAAVSSAALAIKV